MTRSNKKSIASQPVDVKSAVAHVSEGISIYRGRRPGKSEMWLHFVDVQGRQCMVEIVALGAVRDPYGYTARLAIDDGTVYDNCYIGRIAYPAWNRRNEVVAGFVHGQTDVSKVKTTDDMRDFLIAKAKAVADTLVIPIPLAPCFKEGWR